jgi:hypothetical protein
MFSDDLIFTDEYALRLDGRSGAVARFFKTSTFDWHSFHVPLAAPRLCPLHYVQRDTFIDLFYIFSDILDYNNIILKMIFIGDCNSVHTLADITIVIINVSWTLTVFCILYRNGSNWSFHKLEIVGTSNYFRNLKN